MLNVSQNERDPLLYSHMLVTAEFHWIRKPEPLPTSLHARIRHRQSLQECTAQQRDDGRVEIVFAAPQRAAVAGQYAVLYDGAECLGGGEIESVAA